jgi:hypothetical protein
MTWLLTLSLALILLAALAAVAGWALTREPLLWVSIGSSAGAALSLALGYALSK